MNALPLAHDSVAANPRRSTTRSEPRPELRVLPPARFQAPRGPFLLMIGAVMTLGLVGVLLLNTVVAQDAFALSALQAESAALADREQTLEQQVAAAESPQELAEQAVALGMVPSENPVFLRLADGKVLGQPVPGRTPRSVRTKAAAAPATDPTDAPDTSAATTPAPRTPNAMKTKAAR